MRGRARAAWGQPGGGEDRTEDWAEVGKAGVGSGEGPACEMDYREGAGPKRRAGLLRRGEGKTGETWAEPAQGRTGCGRGQHGVAGNSGAELVGRTSKGAGSM